MKKNENNNINFVEEHSKVIKENKGIVDRYREIYSEILISEGSLNPVRSETGLDETPSRSGRRRTARFAVTERV